MFCKLYQSLYSVTLLFTVFELLIFWSKKLLLKKQYNLFIS